MSQVLTIARRELTSLFVSLIAYIVLAVFLLWMGVIFISRVFLPGHPIDIRELIDFSRFGLFLVVPLMTMSVFSEEYRSGRMEMLRTSPVTEFQMLVGKFLGVYSFYLVLIASTFIYLIFLLVFGKPDMGQVRCCYVGMILMGLMYTSIGVFYSACTKEQIVAAVLGIVTLGFFSVISYLVPLIPNDLAFWGLHLHLRGFAEYIGVGSHISDFAKGTLTLSNVAYFVGIAALFQFWTYILLESRKWR